MTVPREVLYRSEDFREWLVELQERALLGSTNQSYAMMRAVLHELRDRSRVDDALRMADALPPLARGIMLERWRPDDAAGAARPSFLDAVKARLEPHTPPPDGMVEDVLAVLAHRIFPQYRATFGERLPPELRPVWRRVAAA